MRFIWGSLGWFWWVGEEKTEKNKVGGYGITEYLSVSRREMAEITNQKLGVAIIIVQI